MRFSPFNLIRWSLLGIFLAVIGLTAGCSTTDADNVSSKPWNSPEGWEGGGLPGMMTQPR